MHIDQLRAILSTHIALIQILLFTLTAGTLWLFEAYILKQPANEKWQRTQTNSLLANNVIDDIRDQGTADEVTLTHWKKTFQTILPEVNSGDVISVRPIPGKKTQLFLNGKKLATIDEEHLDRAFSNM
jgi:hypothetical protein